MSISNKNISNVAAPVSGLSSMAKKALLPFIGFSLMAGAQAANAEVKVSGYVKADFIYDLDQDLLGELSEGSLDTSPGANESSHFRAHARESRINVDYKGEFHAHIEGDFYGSRGNELVANPSGFRLRQAYVQYKNITVGQAWSTFIDRDFGAFPATVDFTGPIVLVNRQGLIRWNLGNLDLALENPEASFRGEEGTSAEEPLPDFVARYAKATDNTYFYVSGVVQSTEVTGGLADGESESYFGASAGGHLKFGSGTQLSGVVTSNAGRYLLYGFLNPTFVTVGNSLETVDYLGYNVSLSQKAGNGAFTFSYGKLNFDNDFAGIAGSQLTLDDAEDITLIHANYMYNVSKNITYMFEVSNLERADFSGNSADNTRLQFAARYSF